MATVMLYQIVVMVSSAAKRMIELPWDTPRFPALLDTETITTSRSARNYSLGGRVSSS
jgi:hypothetical protein